MQMSVITVSLCLLLVYILAVVGIWENLELCSLFNEHVCTIKEIWMYGCVCMYSIMSDSFQLNGLGPARLSLHRIFQATILEWVAIS